MVKICEGKIRVGKKEKEITPTKVGCGDKRLFDRCPLWERKGNLSPLPKLKRKKNITSLSILKCQLLKAAFPLC